MKMFEIIIYFYLTKNCNFTDTAASTPFVAQELSILKKALQDERAERIRIQATEMEKILKNLTPIHVPKPKDNRINELEKDLIKVKHVRNQMLLMKMSAFNNNFLFLSNRITLYR